MAKKKTSAKKPVLKKVAKKTSAKKVVKKAAPKKKAALLKKKAVVKKAPSKKVAIKKAPTKKAAPKKAAKASPKAPVAKAKAVNVAKKPSFQQPKPTTKRLDLSGFVTPLDDRLIVQISGSERMTPGGLYIPDTVSDVSGNLQGKVLAVGRGHVGKKGHMRPMDVKVGDNVVFAEHAGSAIKIQNEDLIILREVDVMGIVSK